MWRHVYARRAAVGVARGDYYSELRSEPIENMERNAKRLLSSDCKQERILSGSIF